MAFHDALWLRSGEIKHIVCRDERHAAYAADAYARVTGKIGVVEVPSGGGALYVVPGISEANLSNIPLVCIASDIATNSEEMMALTDCNQESLFAAVSKWSTKLKSTAKIPQMVRKAFRKSVAGAPGACCLSFPEDILRSEFTGPQSELYAMNNTCRSNGFVCEPTEEVVKGAIKLIAASKANHYLRWRNSFIKSL